MFLDLCHICLRADRKLEIIDSRLADFHDELCNFNMSCSVDPQYCAECEHMLRKVYNFRQKCCRANQILKTWKKSKLKKESLYTALPPTTLGVSDQTTTIIYGYRPEVIPSPLLTLTANNEELFTGLPTTRHGPEEANTRIFDYRPEDKSQRMLTITAGVIDPTSVKVIKLEPTSPVQMPVHDIISTNSTEIQQQSFLSPSNSQTLEPIKEEVRIKIEREMDDFEHDVNTKIMLNKSEKDSNNSGEKVSYIFNNIKIGKDSMIVEHIKKDVDNMFEENNKIDEDNAFGDTMKMDEDKVLVDEIKIERCDSFGI